MASNDSAPRFSALTASTGLISWSDGSLFDGFMLFALVAPTGSGVTWPACNKGLGSFPSQRLPPWGRIYIYQGVFDSNSQLMYNSDIDPPGTRYSFYFYDTTGKRVDVALSSLINVNSATTTITIPTLTVPTVAIAAPTPET